MIIANYTFDKVNGALCQIDYEDPSQDLWKSAGIYHYLNNKKNGEGFTVFRDGAKFIGQFKEGKRNGEGKYTTGDDRVEEGVWVNDIKDGIYKVTYKDLRQEFQVWKNNEFVCLYYP